VNVTVFLDVDGVVAPASRRPPEDTWPDWREYGDSPVRVLLSRAMADGLAALGTVVFLTTWEEMTEELSPCLGWGPREWLARPGCDEDPWWKLDALLRLDPQQPFIWADDELATHEEVVLRAFREAGMDHIPKMLVSPDSYVGLTPPMLEKMAAFAAEHGG
jgi:hypothetical protein